MTKIKQAIGQGRFRVKGGAYVGVGPHFGRVGPLVDIDMKGLTFCYKARKKQPDGLSLDIFLTDRDFYLSYIPFRTVSDSEIPDSPSEPAGTRKCTVRFGDLTPTQMSRLQFLIQNQTNGQLLN